MDNHKYTSSNHMEGQEHKEDIHNNNNLNIINNQDSTKHSLEIKVNNTSPNLVNNNLANNNLDNSSSLINSISQINNNNISNSNHQIHMDNNTGFMIQTNNKSE